MMRLFQFKNTFLSENSEMLAAEYSVIGYFDGLDMKTDSDMNPQEKNRLLSDPLQNVLLKNESFEMCDYFNIVGMRQESDQNFWNITDKSYIFISCIRLKKKAKKIKEIIAAIENKYVAVCYTTLDSSDLVICSKSSSYEEGYRAVEKYHSIVTHYESQNGIQKGFSVLAIRQRVLDDLLNGETKGIEDELLCIILRGVINDWNCINKFISNLKNRLGIADKEQSCKVYGVLGSEDIMIVLKDIHSINWFGLYAKNALMTHPAYQDAFYNVRTEIILNLETGEIE